MPPAGVRRNCFAGLPVRHEPTALFRMPRIAVGTTVEKALVFCGVTKERVQSLLRIEDCGCALRRNWLDQWGFRQQDRIERAIRSVISLYLW
jgi:hypothetical protein